MIIRRNRLLALGLSGIVVLSACTSQTAGDAGVEVIEGELTDQLDLGELEAATCDEPDSEEVGEQFSCSATTESGETVEFVGVMTDEDSINVTASNLMSADDFEKLTADSVQVVATGSDVDPATITVVCPDETTIVSDDGQVFCELTDSSDGTTYQLITNLGDYVLGEGFPDAEYEIGEPIN